MNLHFLFSDPAVRQRGWDGAVEIESFMELEAGGIRMSAATFSQGDRFAVRGYFNDKLLVEKEWVVQCGFENRRGSNC